MEDSLDALQPGSPCDFEDENYPKIPPRPPRPAASEDRNESPGAYFEEISPDEPLARNDDDVEAMECFRASIVSAWSAMKRQRRQDSRTFSTPFGEWYLKCTPRKSYNNRSYDIYVTRPRGVGGRYRKVQDVHNAIDAAIARLDGQR